MSQENKQTSGNTPETNNTQMSQGINNTSKFFQMPPDPYPITTHHRPVFFINPGSTAKIYVKYFSNWDYPDKINLTKGLSVYNATTFQSLSNPQIAISVDPTSIPHKSGENYIVVYSFTAKPDSKGIYGMDMSANCVNFGGGDIDIAVGLNSSQISPQDIPIQRGIAMATCAMGGFSEIQIIGFGNATVEYKSAIGFN